MLNLLGSRGSHGRLYSSESIFLDPTTTYALEDTHFLYLLHWKARLRGPDLLPNHEYRRKRDHVLTMLIKKLADDSFERMALCGIPVDEWDAAPVLDGLECVTLV